ncbi:MAG: hypothetical protein KBT01_04230 [Clostridiales bacterium]|nr:hypothetical protein [Candidatus Blautia equi]
MNKQFSIRFIYYFLGMMVLALGITLNTKSLLGASPIISVPYTISLITGLSFGDLTLFWYCVFVAAEFIIKGKNRKISDLLQIPLSIVFTRFLNLFGSLFQLPTDTMVQKLIILFIAIILTGIGAAVTVNMQLIMNPGDGIVHAIAGKIHKDMGTTKNIVDCTSAFCSAVLGLIFKRNLMVGIGLGTLIAMIGVGRTIAVFNHFFKETMAIQSGLN